MERILKIIIGIILAILLFMWLGSVYKSCGNKSEALTETTAVVDPAEEPYEEFEDEFFDESNEAEVTVETQEPVEEDLFEPEPEPVYEEPPVVESKPVKEPVYEEVKNVPITTSVSGKYLVLAGSYLIRDNAEAMVRKLRAQGYPRAEVVAFDNSRYHSVVADRSADYNKALQVSSQLKRKGIDNYVHTKQD